MSDKSEKPIMINDGYDCYYLTREEFDEWIASMVDAIEKSELPFNSLMLFLPGRVLHGEYNEAPGWWGVTTQPEQ